MAISRRAEPPPQQATISPSSPGVAEDAAAEPGGRVTGPRGPVTKIATGGLFLVGAAFGASQLVHGAYSEITWSAIALGTLALVLALAVGAPRRPSLALVAPLLGLWLWSLLSSGWSESTDASHTAANRWLLYAATVALISWSVNHDRRRVIALLSGASAGVLGVAVWMLARMLGGHGPELFLGTRLNDPLGYVNGQAAYLLAGAWPALALAERRGSRPAAALAGLGLGGFVALIGIGLLAQSRSWEAALAGAVLLMLGVVPGRRRRAAALLLAGVTVAAIFTPLARVWRDPSPRTGTVTIATTHHAALLIVIGAVAAGLIWAVAVAALDLGAPARSRARGAARLAASITLAGLALAAAIVIGVNAGRISHQIRSQYDAFVHLAPASGDTRLFSGAGDRYDYWRVAMLEFRSAPINGVGAGNYQPGYYLHRRTSEAIQQPHSIELQTLAELGLVGALLLAAYLVVVAVGLGRTARDARRGDPLAGWVAVAAGGVFTVWLIQTSVDWMHLIPGLTAIALAAAVGLSVRPGSRAAIVAGRGRLAMIMAAVAIVIAGALTIAPRVLSLQAQTSAQNALARRAPRSAIRDATTALEYDPSSVSGFVLRAAGFARLHDFAAARADLHRALRTEPRNWATWALLGDLLTRRGDRSGARAAYAHALALDPLESELVSAAGASR